MLENMNSFENGDSQYKSHIICGIWNERINRHSIHISFLHKSHQLKGLFINSFYLQFSIIYIIQNIKKCLYYLFIFQSCILSQSYYYHYNETRNLNIHFFHTNHKNIHIYLSTQNPNGEISNQRNFSFSKLLTLEHQIVYHTKFITLLQKQYISPKKKKNPYLFILLKIISISPSSFRTTIYNFGLWTPYLTNQTATSIIIIVTIFENSHILSLE